MSLLEVHVFLGRSVVRPSGSRSLLAAESLELRSCAVAQSKRGAQGVQGFKGFRVNSKFRLCKKRDFLGRISQAFTFFEKF